MATPLKKFEFENTRRAMEVSAAWEGSVVVRMNGKTYVMTQEYADELAAGGKEFAYLCDHGGRIATVPVND